MREFEGKKLLLLGANRLECDIVKRAQDMGIYVVVADYYTDSPAKLIADEAVLIDALDVDALVDYCRTAHIDAVTTGFVDILLQPCYEVCKRLGLPCYLSPKMIEVSTNKAAFKEACQQYGVPVPKTYLIDNHIPEEMYAELQYPVFVKPLDASGSRGAGVCNNREELDARFEEAIGYSDTDNAIIEEYIKGRDFLLDYIAVDGEFRLLSMFDRFVTSERASAINYADISMSPSNALNTYLEKVNDKVINMYKALGFTDGLFFMQGYSDGDRITFFEMGCRLGGSFYNHQKECLGHDALTMTVRYALSGKMTDSIKDIPVDIANYNGKYALDCNFLLKGTNETVSVMKGVDEVIQLPSCISTIQYEDIGYYYTKDRTIDRPIYTVEIVANSRQKVIEDVNYINRVFDVLNEKGESLLFAKYDPIHLFNNND